MPRMNNPIALLACVAAVLLAFGAPLAARNIERLALDGGFAVQVSDTAGPVVADDGKVYALFEKPRPYIGGKWLYFSEGQAAPAEVKTVGTPESGRTVTLEWDTLYTTSYAETTAVKDGVATIQCDLEYDEGYGPLFLCCLRIPLACLDGHECTLTDLQGKTRSVKADAVQELKPMEVQSVAIDMGASALLLDLRQKRGRTANGRNVWKFTAANKDYLFFELLGHAGPQRPPAPSAMARVQVVPAGTGLEAVQPAPPPVQATEKEFSNELLKVGLLNFENLIWRLQYKPDDIDLIRFRVPPKGFFHGLLLSNWNWLTEGTKRDHKVLDDGMAYTIEKENRRLETKATLRPKRAVVDFEVRLDNNGAETPLKDRYFFDVAVVPGGLEKEYNPAAWLYSPQEDGTVKGEELMGLWGECRMSPTRNFLALVDVGSKVAFVECVTGGDLSCFTVKVGRRDTHGSRDWGRRATVGAIFDRVRLAQGEVAEYRYHWCVLKGLQAIHAYSDGLGAGVVEEGRVWKGGGQRLCIDFAAAGDCTREVQCLLEVSDSQGQGLVSLDKTFPLTLRHGEAARRELTFDLPQPCAWPLTATVTFLENGQEIGAWRATFFDKGETPAETADALRRLRLEMDDCTAALPYLGAETPASLAAAAEVDFHLRKVDDALARLCFNEAADCRQRATETLARLRDAVEREKTRPASPQLRKMADRKPTEYCRFDGANLYAPDGCRLFLWGALLQFKISNWHSDEWIENYVKMAKSYGNFISIYLISSWKEDDPTHRELLERGERLLRRMKEEGLYITLHAIPMFRDVTGYSADDMVAAALLIPECQKRHAEGGRYTAQAVADLGACVPFTVPYTIEPSMPRPASKLAVEHWNRFLTDKYGSLEAARNRWGLPAADTPVPVPDSAVNEHSYAPMGRDYAEFLSTLLGRKMEEEMGQLDESGARTARILGASVFSAWPTHPVPYMTKYIADKRIVGSCVDKYEGFWWGAVKSPPEIWWSDCQIYGEKPILLTEWGVGCGMDIRAAWHRADYALNQAWGKYFAGLKVRACCAWDLIPDEFCGLFTKEAQPKGVTASLMQVKDELIANPLPKRLQTLVLASRLDNTMATYIAATRLLSLQPQLGIDFSFGTFDDLKVFDLSKYKLVVCYAEGMPEDVLDALKGFQGKVLVVGRPMLSTAESAVEAWRRHGFFLKDGITARGPGGVVERTLVFDRPFGGRAGGDQAVHCFAETESASVKRTSLLPDVEVILGTQDEAALMRQGNCFWWTDMMGYASENLPDGHAFMYPELRPLEREIYKGVCDAAQVAYRDSPVQVWVSNDVAFTYDTHSGHVKVFNAGTIQIPPGRFLKHYERFADGIICRVAGTPDAGVSPWVVLRCPAERVAKCLLDGQEAVWEKRDDCHVAVKLPPENGDYAIQISF